MDFIDHSEYFLDVIIIIIIISLITQDEVVVEAPLMIHWPSISVVNGTLRLSKRQVCLFPDVIFLPLLSASSSSSQHCAEWFNQMLNFI